MIIVAQRLVGKVINNGGIAYHITLGILRTRIHLRVHLLPYTTTRGATGAPFLEDDSAFGIYLFRQEQQTAAPIVHHEQRRVHDSFAIGRHIRQTVNGLVNGGVGIDVTTEVHAYGLEIIDDTLAREMLRTVERHVLQEVRQTVLVVLLEDSTYRLGDVELTALFGLLVVADVIGQTVV